EELAAAGGDAHGGVQPDHHAQGVQPVDAVVAQLAGAVVPVPVPVVVEAVLVEGALRRRPQPQVVVHLGGRLAVRLLADALAVAGDPGAGEGDLPELAGAHELRGAGEVRTTAPLGAQLDDALVLAGGLDHAPALDQVVRGRLLDVDVLAGLAGPDG